MSQTEQMDKRILDRVAANHAQNIVDQALKTVKKAEAKDVDNLITKALGVLQENGVYACFLFLFSRTRDKDRDIAEVVREQLLALAAADLPFGWEKPRPMDAETVLPYVSNKICAELDPLLMTKELFEQTLIYARYGAKARKKKGG
jgi:hypothetical protein